MQEVELRMKLGLNASPGLSVGHYDASPPPLFSHF